MVDDGVREAALPELEQAVERLGEAVVMARSIVTDGEEPTEDQLRQLWWAADAVTSIWEHGVCVNCGRPLCVHYGVGGRECTSGAVVVDMDSGEELARVPGAPGWFTPRGGV